MDQHPLVVIMGDIVRSQAAKSPSELHQKFNDAVSDANTAFKNGIVSPLTITLGDEFQGLCTSFGVGISVMRHVRWLLLNQGVDCRFVVGRIFLATPLNSERAWNMMGPGLAEAREKLEQKRDPNAYRFSLPETPTMEILLDGIGLSLTDVEAGWTARQREIVIATLISDIPTSDLLKRFDVTESVFYKIRRAAKFDFYNTMWSAAYAAGANLDGKSK